MSRRLAQDWLKINVHYKTVSPNTVLMRPSRPPLPPVNLSKLPLPFICNSNSRVVVIQHCSLPVLHDLTGQTSGPDSPASRHTQISCHVWDIEPSLLTLTALTSQLNHTKCCLWKLAMVGQLNFMSHTSTGSFNAFLDHFDYTDSSNSPIPIYHRILLINLAFKILNISQK